MIRMATEEAIEFLEGILGKQSGYVELASLDRSVSGRNGRGVWEPQFFAWPKQAKWLVRCAEKLSDQGLDVYFSAHVMKTRSRKPDEVVDLSFIHADLDREKNDGFDGNTALIDYDKARKLGVGVVRTSQYNFQLYMHLDEPVSSLKEYQELCYRLGHTFAVDPSDVDHKVSPADMMRFPGTTNHKPGKNFTAEVIWPARRHRTVTGLVKTIPHRDKSGEGGGGGGGEATDASRSGMVYKMVNDCAEAGNDYATARKKVLRDFPDYEDDHPGDIKRIWEKAKKAVLPKVGDADEIAAELKAEAAALTGFVQGGTFIHAGPKNVPAVWGNEETRDVLWAPGEGLMITGATGVGKSTLAGLLVRGRMGWMDEVGGLPVVPGDKRVLYLALDRPAQIQRALRRQLHDIPANELDRRLSIWSSFLPGQFEKDEFLLAKMAIAADADTVVVDSLKDALPSVSDEKIALQWNANVRNCARLGIEVIVLHHQRKEGNGEGSRKAKTMHDVFGSNWLTAGLGSVLLLWRETRKELLELTVLKGPTGEGDKIELLLNNEKGTLVEALGEDDKRDHFASPSTVKEFAQFLYGEDDHRACQKARREVNKLLDAELIQSCKVPPDATGKQKNATWYVRS